MHLTGVDPLRPLLDGLYADLNPGPYVEAECQAHRVQMQIDSVLNAITSKTFPDEFEARWKATPSYALGKGRGEDGATALHIVAAKGNLSLIRYLINRDASLLSAVDAAGNNALTYAVAYDQYGAVTELLDQGISPNIASNKEWSISISPSCERSYLKGTTPMLVALYTPSLKNRSVFVDLLFQSKARIPKEAMQLFLQVKREQTQIKEALEKHYLRV